MYYSKLYFTLLSDYYNKLYEKNMYGKCYLHIYKMTSPPYIVFYMQDIMILRTTYGDFETFITVYTYTCIIKSYA